MFIVQAEKERELRERERRLLAEQERVERERRLHLEQQRRLEQERARAREREEQEQREIERKLKEERDQQWQEQERRERQEQERRERQEQERRERERRERVEEERAKREREQKREREELERERMLPHSQQQRLGKRPFSTDVTSYESVKRQAVHDIRGASEGYSSPSSVFGRLDPPTQNRSDAVAGQSLMGRSGGGGDYRRSEQDRDHSHPYERSRSSTGSAYRTAGYSQPVARERHTADGSVYSVPVGASRSLAQTANVYGKVMSGLSAGSGVQQVVKQRPTSDAAALSRVPTDIINAATQALENIRKSVASAGGQVPGAKLSPSMRVPQVPSASLPAHLQQLAAASAAVASSHPGAGVHDFLSGSSRVAMLPGRQSMMPVTPGGSSVIGKYSPQVKLPPEDERYNNPRRFSRPGGQQGRPSTYKRLI